MSLCRSRHKTEQVEKDQVPGKHKYQMSWSSTLPLNWSYVYAHVWLSRTSNINISRHSVISLNTYRKPGIPAYYAWHQFYPAMFYLCFNSIHLSFALVLS